MRFHLIDRVEEWEPAKSVRARKVTSYSEDYWEEVDGELRMPPPFVLEAFCQAGTWLIMITTDRRKRAALLQVGSVTWHRDIRPGDVLVMEGETSSFGDETAVLGGRVTVDGETVLECEDVMCALIDSEDLADLDTTERLQKMLTQAEEEE
ncbi:MAG: 3-hydroxyacyl-[acyl-carrier-protein] dehydratase [Acidimicrobiaceae bacterium]